MKKIKCRKSFRRQQIIYGKSCPEHGNLKQLYGVEVLQWRSWVRNKERAYIKNPATFVQKGCPFDCGLCSEHRQHTCTALIEVTQRCNLNCSFCFANSSLIKKETLL